MAMALEMTVPLQPIRAHLYFLTTYLSYGSFKLLEMFKMLTELVYSLLWKEGKGGFEKRLGNRRVECHEQSY